MCTDSMYSITWLTAQGGLSVVNCMGSCLAGAWLCVYSMYSITCLTAQAGWSVVNSMGSWSVAGQTRLVGADRPYTNSWIVI